MSQTALTALKWYIEASLERDLAGKAVGWEFAMNRNGTEFVSVCGGYARAPWEVVDNPGLPTALHTRIKLASMSKMITACGLMIAIGDWNLVLDKAQELWTDWRNTPITGPQLMHLPADFPSAIPALRQILGTGWIDLINRVAQQTGLSAPVVMRVFGHPLRLSLDTKLVELLGYRLKQVTFGQGVTQVTIRHVLSHTSKLNFSEAVSYDQWNDQFDFLGLLKTALSKNLTGMPGTYPRSYNNQNYGIARALIDECIADETGQEYERFIKRRIFDPLGCHDVSCTSELARDVTLYYRNPLPTSDSPDNAPAPGYAPAVTSRKTAGAGGWFASPRDLTLFLDAVRTSRFLPQALTDKWLDTEEPVGWWIEQLASGTYLSHNGSNGSAGEMAIMPNGMTAALLVNSKGVDVGGTFWRALKAGDPIIEFPPRYIEAGGVRIRNPLGFGELRFTLDPTAPISSFSLYVNELPLAANMIVRAVVWEDGALVTGPSQGILGYLPGEKRPANASGMLTTAGLRWRYVEGPFDKLPGTIGFDRHGTITDLVVPSITAGFPPRDYDYAIEFEGFIEVPRDGTYTFSTKSDDGSRLWIGNIMLVDNDGRHFEVLKTGPGIGLKAGKHPFLVEFFQRRRAQKLEVRWAGPSITDAKVPAGAFSFVP